MGVTITQNREDRPYAVTGGGGVIKEISTKYQRKCLKNADRSFVQATQCQEINCSIAFY
jgi:nitrogenase molybdenum-iron protein alpha chain